MIDFVLDASALVTLVLADAPDPGLYRRSRTGSGAAPELIDAETLQVLRRMERQGIERSAIARAVRRVQNAPISRTPHRPLLDRVWALRATLTAYDATYVALAERLGVPLLTCDARLGRAHGHHAAVVVYPTS